MITTRLATVQKMPDRVPHNHNDNSGIEAYHIVAGEMAPPLTTDKAV